MMGNSFGLLTPSSPCPLTSALGFLSGTLTPRGRPSPTPQSSRVQMCVHTPHPPGQPGS